MYTFSLIDPNTRLKPVFVSPTFSVFDWVEKYAPGFKSSVVGRDILTPPDLERIFGLTGGVCCVFCLCGGRDFNG